MKKSFIQRSVEAQKNSKYYLLENEEPKKFDNKTKKAFLEIVSTYSKYQEQLDRKSDIQEIAETLYAITEAARELAINESDDWFDAHTVKRNMSELDKLGKQFQKVAMETKKLDQRLNGLYEDMGHILSRYYKVGELTEDEMKTRLGMNESGFGDKLKKKFHQLKYGKLNTVAGADDDSYDIAASFAKKQKTGLAGLGQDKRYIYVALDRTDDNGWEEEWKYDKKTKKWIGESKFVIESKDCGCGCGGSCGGKKINESKTIKVKWDDDNNAFEFSDGETAVADYDGEFKYRGKWFTTIDTNSEKDLKRKLEKAFRGTKFVFEDMVETGGYEKKIGKKDTRNSWNKHLRPVGKRQANKKTRKMGKNISEETRESKTIKDIQAGVKKNEIKFYDELEIIYIQLGHMQYMKWLGSALKGFGVDMRKDPKIKTKADAEEKLYNLSK